MHTHTRVHTHTLSHVDSTHSHIHMNCSDVQYKVVLVGDSGVGKTSLILKFTVSKGSSNVYVQCVLVYHLPSFLFDSLILSLSIPPPPPPPPHTHTRTHMLTHTHTHICTHYRTMYSMKNQYLLLV